MATFDVYCNPGAHAATIPFLVGVQSEHLIGLNASSQPSPRRELRQRIDSLHEQQDGITGALDWLFDTF